MKSSASTSAPPNAAGSSESSSELGAIRIHDNVLADLVSRAALSVPGVSRLSGSSFFDNLAGMVGTHSRAIEIVKSPQDDKLQIVVKLNLLFGAVIPDTALAVQRAVIEQVEQASGLIVSSVDVLIQQLEEAKPSADAPNQTSDPAQL